LITSTPSAVAWSIALTTSTVVAPSPPPSSTQYTLYMASRAAGAIPDMFPTGTPPMLAATPWLPAAMLDVSCPCGKNARGERWSSGWMAPAPSLK
jgi:hypothetical protein